MAAVLRRGLAALLVSAVWLMQAAPAAALLGWSVSGSHTAVQAGGVTVATLRVTNDNLLSLLGIDDIGCIHVDVGSSFEIQSVSTAKSQWVTSHSGGRAVAHSTSGGARLGVGESVTFSITALAESAGSFGWAVRVIRDQDCDGSYITGAETFSVNVTPTPAPTPTPTPRPTPTPTPRPTPMQTPTPTPTPTPLLPLPSLPLASLPLSPLPATSSPSPSPRPAASGAPAPEGGERAPSPTPASSPDETRNASPRPTAGAGGGGAPSDGAGAIGPRNGSSGGDGGPSVQDGGTPQGGAAPQGGGAPLTPDARIFPIDAASGEVGVEVGGIDLLGDPVWAVPAATIAGPGLLVLLWLLLQAIGAAAWMPSVRRLRGEEQSEAGSV